jgi:sigma-E factor negative regulatory protein RseB
VKLQAVRYCLLVVLLAPLSLSAFAVDCPQADQAALEWLSKMSRSSSEVNYHGVVTFQRGEKMQVMQVSHSVVDGTASESMTQLTGQGAQVVRVDHPLHCVHPGHRLLRVGSDIKDGHCGLASYYRFSVEDGERVAGRNAVRINIEPGDMYRYGYVLELDRETGLLLKAQTEGHGRKILERFQFASLSFVEGETSTAGVNVVHRAHHPTPASAQQIPDGGDWRVAWLPEGFTATDVDAQDGSRRTYTDGLAVFSVFLEELAREIRPGEGVVRRGGTTSYTRGMDLAGQSVLVTVIGEVPLNTARMVADSVGRETQ